MLFATYQSYTPPNFVPKKPINPWVIVGGLCGGCFLIAVLLSFGGAYWLFRTKGPYMQRTFNTIQFVNELGKHNYQAADARLTTEAQGRIDASRLKGWEEAAESRYGRFYGANSTITQQNINGLGDPNKIREMVYRLNYANGTVDVLFKFDLADPTNKIHDVVWGTVPNDRDRTKQGIKR